MCSRIASVADRVSASLLCRQGPGVSKRFLTSVVPPANPFSSLSSSFVSPTRAELSIGAHWKRRQLKEKMSDDDNVPSRRLCYDGTRGAAIRVFKRDFLTKARAHFGKDDLEEKKELVQLRKENETLRMVEKELRKTGFLSESKEQFLKSVMVHVSEEIQLKLEEKEKVHRVKLAELEKVRTQLEDTVEEERMLFKKREGNFLKGLKTLDVLLKTSEQTIRDRDTRLADLLEPVVTDLTISHPTQGALDLNLESVDQTIMVTGEWFIH